MASRQLTQGEIALASTVFGNSINYSQVRVHDQKHNIFQASNEVVTPNGEIYYPSGLYSSDFSTASSGSKALFIHELSHVMQDHNGMDVIWRRLTGGGNYNYDAIFHGVPFHKLPMEAQAEFIEDLYRKRNNIPIDPNKDGGVLEDPDRPLSEYEDRLPMDLPQGESQESSLDDLGLPYFPNAPIPALMAAPADQFGQAHNVASPLVLDLDGDGVEASVLGYGPGASETYFDIDNDGFAERTAWATGGDGLLAIDTNSNGKIDNQSELFGNSSIYADGFAALAALDSNNDDQITSADSQWGNLRVWIDANNNGITDSGELATLSSLNITQIDLDATPQSNIFNNENAVTASSTFVLNGQTRSVEDVWFRNDQMDTRQTGSPLLNPEVISLPNLKGFGNLNYLGVAMSQDSSLLSLVQDFVSGWSPAKFLNSSALDAEVQAILHKWAGVDSVSSTSRGTYIDAKILTFMEVLTGQPYGGTGVPGVNPAASGPANAVVESYEMAFNALKAQLIVQAGAQSLFSVAPIYDSASGELVGGMISEQSISILVSQASPVADKSAYWQSISTFLLNVKPLGQFSTAESAILDNAIKATDSSLSWISIANASLSQYPSLTLNGTDFSDHLVGAANIDYLYGNDGDDIVNGAAGNDQLFGGEGVASRCVLEFDLAQFPAG